MELRVLALMSVLSLAELAGCAVASEDLDGVAPNRKRDGGSPDTGSEGEDDTGTATADDTGSSSDSGSSSTDSGSSSMETGTETGPSTDSGMSSKDTGGPSMDTSGGTPCSTLTAADCTSSTSIGSVSGDTGSGIKTASGTDSKFVRVTVSEDDSSLTSSKDPRARITLKSTGGNFDLYVYQGKTKGDGGGIECTTFKVSSTNPASDDVVSLAWNDNRPFGGHDDTRVLSIEVRATMPSCDGASWTLTVEGNK